METSDMERNYFMKEVAVLRVFGTSLHGNEGPVYRVYSAIVLFFTLTYPVVTFIEAFKHDFDTASYLLTYVFTTSIANFELIVVLSNGDKLLKLLESLGKEPYLPNGERGGIIEEEIISGCVSITTIQSITSWICISSTIGMATVYTLLKRIESSDYHDWEFTYGPITLLNVTYSPNYEITWFYQVFCAYSTGFNYCTINLIMAGILAHVSVQFKLLQNNMERIIENAYKVMIKERKIRNISDNHAQNYEEINAQVILWRYLRQSLDSTMTYHLKILDVFFEMEEIFSSSLLVAFIFSLGVLCFVVYNASLLSITNIRFLKSCTDTLAALFPILLLSYWSEEVASECQQVSDAAAQINFVGADLKFQKSLTMIVQRSQRPVKLKAGKLVDISLPTFVWILRTSYSAFMVLRKVNLK